MVLRPVSFNPFDALGLDPTRRDLDKPGVLRDAYRCAVRHVFGNRPGTPGLAFPTNAQVNEARDALNASLEYHRLQWVHRHRSTWNPNAALSPSDVAQLIPGLEGPPAGADAAHSLAVDHSSGDEPMDVTGEDDHDHDHDAHSDNSVVLTGSCPAPPPKTGPSPGTPRSGVSTPRASANDPAGAGGSSWEFGEGLKNLSVGSI